MNASPEITIRSAVAGDIEAVLVLDRSIDLLPHWPIAEYRVVVAGPASEPLRCLFVAESDGKLCGLVSGVLHVIAGDCFAELESVGVVASMQRQGLGRKLCDLVVAWSVFHDASHLDLEVRSRSEGAIALYRELGFESIGTRSAYYRDPMDSAILMRLDLKLVPPPLALLLQQRP